MRISCVKDDPGYQPGAEDGRYEVFVDGRPAPRCYTADEEAGIAWCHKAGPDGRVMVNADGTGTVKEELRGKVEIRLRGGPYG